jgi:acyl-CoA dehydrogenase
MHRLLRDLLAGPTDPIVSPDARAFWDVSCKRWVERQRAGAEHAPMHQAVLGGFQSDRVGHAFVVGYQAALRTLLDLAPGALASFCVTEAGGNRPRAIATRLEEASGGQLRLTGEKRWSTLAPVADVLCVVARSGTDEAGRPRLVAVAVPSGTRGVAVTPMPATPFAPEVPHAEIRFTDAVVAATARLPGDAYERYVKPFRTAEDLHVHGALVGYVIGVARRASWPRDALEALGGHLAAVVQLATADPSAPETHVALAGVLTAGTALLDAHEPFWRKVHDEERLRWHRDRQLLAVAGAAREARRQRAWQRLEDS